MKYTTVLQNISPEDRNCFSFTDNGTPTRRKLILTHFSNPENFQKRVERAIKNEHTRMIFSTKNIDFGVLVIADSFEGRGDLEEKKLKQQINFFITKKDYLLYPSSTLDNSFYRNLNSKLHKSWPEDLECFEADYISIYNCLVACAMKTEYKTVGIHGDSFFKNQFVEMLKQNNEHLNYQTFGFDILLTDRYIDRNYASELIELKPKVVVCASDIDLDEGYVKELIDNNIHVVPGSISLTGNFYVNEGLIEKNRNMEENMQLTSVSSLHMNKAIWHDVLNSRKNFYSIIEEIYQASIDPSAKTNFKLGEEGVGAMSFKA
jgi:hypothetical protein